MVRNITYRLKSILRRLLKAPEPVPVKDLADDLRISRRTVFRELANTETLQHSYGLSIGSKPGEGIYIDGDEKGRESLSKTLNRMGGDEPKDRSERQLRLMIELLEEAKLQKLVNYADKFGVSVATISNDLDEIETRLSGYNLALSRRSGSGVSIAGEEQGYRRAFLSAVHEMPRILAEFAPDENALINRLDTRVDVGKWMTPHSLNAFEYYLVVALHRYRCGHPLPASEASPGNLPAAESIAAAIAGECGVALSEAEINAISLEITACSINVPTMDKSSKRYSQLLRLAHELIAAFDPTKTPSLDQDDVLIDGLVSYLFSAEIRLRYRVELYDPLAEQMSTGYSEVMEKTRHAAKVLRDIGGGWLPESEISLLATHFGAAVSRLNEQRRRELSVRVGVVCIHGMGTSYLLTTQARKAFPDEARFEVGCWSDSHGWSKFDFLLSTTPIPEANLPVVVVSLLLNQEDVEKIRAAIAKAALRKDAAERINPDVSFAKQCETIENLAADAKSVLATYQAVAVDPEISFPDLAALAGRQFGADPEMGETIAASLLEREQVTTQVLHELDLVFLHCRTTGVTHPVFGMLAPDGGVFADPYFKKVKAAIVMLIPVESSPERVEMMGSISTALVNNDIFLTDILAGDGERVRQQTESILERFLHRFVTNGLDPNA